MLNNPLFLFFNNMIIDTQEGTFIYKYEFPTSMTEVISVGEKGQIVIPKKLREEYKIQKGTKLLISEDKDKISIKPIRLEEKHLLMLLSESSLKKVWNNKYDERWDDVL